MPQDTTIFWDGYGKPPALIDTLPPDLRGAVLQIVAVRKGELADNDPAFTYIFIAAVFLLFLGLGLYTKRIMKRRSFKDEGVVQ